LIFRELSVFVSRAWTEGKAKESSGAVEIGEERIAKRKVSFFFPRSLDSALFAALPSTRAANEEKPSTHMILLARLLEALDGHQLARGPMATPEHGAVGALAELAELLVGLIMEGES
jgi:hypothetical protein